MDSERQQTLGIDFGLKTVKAVVVDVISREILWNNYQRHETRQADKTLELLKAIESRFGELCGRARETDCLRRRWESDLFRKSMTSRWPLRLCIRVLEGSSN